MRTFATGATRDSDDGKYDYEGFVCPFVEERYAQYMHSHRRQSDGSMRASDNWQKGIPLEQYMKSLIRHTNELHRHWRRYGVFDEQTACAILFNTRGGLHEVLKRTGRC